MADGGGGVSGEWGSLGQVLVLLLEDSSTARDDADTRLHCGMEATPAKLANAAARKTAPTQAALSLVQRARHAT